MEQPGVPDQRGVSPENSLRIQGEGVLQGSPRSMTHAAQQTSQRRQLASARRARGAENDLHLKSWLQLLAFSYLIKLH